MFREPPVMSALLLFTTDCTYKNDFSITRALISEIHAQQHAANLRVFRVSSVVNVIKV